MRKNTSGFTIVEFILVIVVIGILTAVGSVMWSNLTGSSANNVRTTEVKQWASTFDLYKSRYGVLPVLPQNDSTPVVVCLGDFKATGGKCGNLSPQSYNVDNNLLASIKSVGKVPEDTAPQASTKVVGPVAYVSQKTSGGTTTVTVVYIGFFQGNACPNGLLNVTSQQPAAAILTGVSSTAACALQDSSFTYPAGSPPPTPTPAPTPTPTPAPTPTPTPIPAPERVRNHSCYVHIGKAYCWGYNDFGQLGNGNQTNKFTPTAVTTSGVLNGKTITAIAAGDSFSCAVANGKPYCWGANNMGQLGIGTATYFSANPVAVDTSGVLSGKTVTDISAGYGFACVIASGKPYCWGGNYVGQLGNNSTHYSYVPVAVNTSGVLNGKTVTDISVNGGGNAYACVVASGKAYCWGSNRQGQLGTGNRTNSRVPVAVNTSGVLNGKTVTVIASSVGPDQSGGGYDGTCVVASGRAYCWGENASGKNGDGTKNNSYYPVAVNTSGVLSGKTVTDISLGEASTCAVASGKAYCWGTNGWGQLGNGTKTKSLVPVAVSTSGVLGGKTVTKIDAVGSRATAGGSLSGYGTICAVANGHYYCWGNNQFGQFGNGTTNDSSVPVVVPGL